MYVHNSFHFLWVDHTVITAITAITAIIPCIYHPVLSFHPLQEKGQANRQRNGHTSAPAHRRDPGIQTLMRVDL